MSLALSLTQAENDFARNAALFQATEWQGQEIEHPTYELLDMRICEQIPDLPAVLVEACKPNMPWAEEHFLERVSGIPYNPPPSHVRWPYYSKKWEDTGIQKGGKFSHTYPERMWCYRGNQGIRYHWGNLKDLVALLQERPHTRQAYLPLWFPEDLTAARKNERVPCTLGYHFLLRGGRLSCWYAIRSCDLVRHFRDDVYMACRLVQWVIDQVSSFTQEGDIWHLVRPGTLYFTAHSMHCFEHDMPKLRKEHAGDEYQDDYATFG